MVFAEPGPNDFQFCFLFFFSLPLCVQEEKCTFFYTCILLIVDGVMLGMAPGVHFHFGSSVSCMPALLCVHRCGLLGHESGGAGARWQVG